MNCKTNFDIRAKASFSVHTSRVQQYCYLNLWMEAQPCNFQTWPGKGEKSTWRGRKIYFGTNNLHLWSDTSFWLEHGLVCPLFFFTQRFFNIKLNDTSAYREYWQILRDETTCWGHVCTVRNDQKRENSTIPPTPDCVSIGPNLIRVLSHFA